MIISNNLSSLDIAQGSGRLGHFSDVLPKNNTVCNREFLLEPWPLAVPLSGHRLGPRKTVLVYSIFRGGSMVRY